MLNFNHLWQDFFDYAGLAVLALPLIAITFCSLVASLTACCCAAPRSPEASAPDADGPEFVSILDIPCPPPLV